MEELLSGNSLRRQQMVRRMAELWPQEPALAIAFALTSATGVIEDSFGAAANQDPVVPLGYRLSALVSADIHAVQAMGQVRAKTESLRENASFELDGVSYAIDVANASDYGPDEENDFSLVTSLSYGQVRFLFAGDAENARLGELLSEGGLSHDVLKVPHHGKAEKLSAAFFQAVSPRYAVITSDEKNLEDEAVPVFLRQFGAEVFLTREGTVTALTDGESIQFTQERAER